MSKFCEGLNLYQIKTAIVIIFLFSFSIVAGADIREDFELYKNETNIGGQRSWKEGLYGRHPSCIVTEGIKYGEQSKVLAAPGGGDYHVYRLLPTKELTSVVNGNVIRIGFNFKGQVQCGIGMVTQSSCNGIMIKCGRSISVKVGEKIFHGISSLNSELWHEIIVIINKDKDIKGRITLTVATASPKKKNKKYEVVVGLDRIILPLNPKDPEKWNGLYIRLDNGAMFDDFKIASSDNISALENKLVPARIKQKFKPITDHVILPREYLDLSGIWEATGISKGQSDNANLNWQPVLVPDSHKNLFAGKSYVWFRRNFILATKDPNRRYFLCFERITDSCEVSVNGKVVGASDDGHFPFRIDATAALRSGSNSVLIKVAGTKTTGGATIRPSGWSWLLSGFQGIPYPVHLETVGKVYIDDLFVISHLTPESMLETHVKLTNGFKERRNITVEASIGDEFHHNPVNIEMQPGETREIVLRDLWLNPKLWWPYDPHLYYLDVRIKLDNKTIDAFRQRFGFRELRVNGADILINGVRFLHRRDSIIPHWRNSSKEYIKEYIEQLRQRGFNGSRLHGDASLRFVRVCDELGWLVCSESAINEPRGGQVAPEFWDNAKKHLNNMVKTMRNSPSVIYWSISNEFASYYMKGCKSEKDAVDGKMLSFGRMIERLDPTRTWTVSGDGSLGGWGKDGNAPTLNFHYPSEPFKQQFTIPNNVFWLDSKKTVSWQGIKWNKDKPLMFGEDLFMPYGIHPPTGMARWAGDKSYDINNGYYEGWFNCIRMFAEGYYFSRLSVWNPWATHANQEKNPLFSLGQIMPDYLLATLEHNSTFFSGEKVNRTLYIYNEKFKNKECRLDSKLYFNNKILNSDTAKTFQLNAGSMVQLAICLPMPQVTTKTHLEWHLKLLSNGKKLTDRIYKYTVYPEYKHFQAPAGCALLSSYSNTLSNIYFPEGRYSSLKEVLNSGIKSLVLTSSSTLKNKDMEILNKAVSEGLKVLWLEVSGSRHLPVKLERTKQESFVFVRAPHDSAMCNIDNQDLAGWRKDGYVVSCSFAKPHDGNFDILSDTGTALSNTALLRIYRGKGFYLLSSLPLVSRYKEEPAVAFIVKELISSLNAPVKVGRHKLVVSKYTDQKTKNMLNKFNIPFNLEQAVDIDTEGQGLCSKEGQPDKVYWVDGNDITDADLKFINLCCKQGGTVIVDSLQPDGAVALSKLTGNDIILERTFATELIKKKDSILLMDGISNDDLYWRQSPDFYKDAFARSIGKKYISKDISMIDYAIKENKHISVPVKPGGIGIMPYIDGKIIMFTIKWSDFLKIRTVKVSRTLVSLLHNLGVFTEDNNSNLKNWIYIDLKSFMDREFWKKEKNTLAWFDKGNDDMRYFPVNRPGIDATLNLPQPPEKFPANPVLLGNVSFKLENPDHNSGKGCLLLRKGEQLVLPINAIYDKMWMLGALESNDKKGETVATVIFNYTNNSKEQVEIKAGIHVNGYQYSDDTEKGIIAWIGNNPARRNNVLWCWSIQNPQPNHEVKSITLTNGNRKQFIIIAVTLENNR